MNEHKRSISIVVEAGPFLRRRRRYSVRGNAKSLIPPIMRKVYSLLATKYRLLRWLQTSLSLLLLLATTS